MKLTPAQSRLLYTIREGSWVGRHSVHEHTYHALQRRGIITVAEGSRVVLTTGGRRLVEDQLK